MSLLSAHLGQIAISCEGIDSLPFPPPKIFTSALFSNHDITALIRDTEAHERALFSVPPPPPPSSTTTTTTPAPSKAASSNEADATKSSSRRQTVFSVASGEVTTSAAGGSRSTAAARRHTAVSAVLGGKLHDQIRLSERGRSKDSVDVEVLLRGAEKLCGVYPLPGALERIASQRTKYAQCQNTLTYYEAKVTEQAEALGRMNKDMFVDDEDEDHEDGGEVKEEDESAMITEDDLKREEDEVRELDKKKRELQQRLKAIEKDLGGLLNM